jgi:hypothetical protein
MSEEKPAEEEKRFCPLDPEGAWCVPRCAWWIEASQECVVPLLFRYLTAEVTIVDKPGGLE